jgi:hypothetical protein
LSCLLFWAQQRLHQVRARATGVHGSRPVGAPSMHSSNAALGASHPSAYSLWSFQGSGVNICPAVGPLLEFLMWALCPRQRRGLCRHLAGSRLWRGAGHAGEAATGSGISFAWRDSGSLGPCARGVGRAGCVKGLRLPAVWASQARYQQCSARGRGGPDGQAILIVNNTPNSSRHGCQAPGDGRGKAMRGF